MGEINWKNKCWVTTIYLVNSEFNVLLTWNKNLQTWIPVGGHMEPGETPEESIIREVKEETGFEFEFIKNQLYQDGNVKVIKPSQIQIENVPHHDKHMNFVFFGKCTSFTNKGETDENEKLRWFSREEILETTLLESVKKQSLKAIESAKLQTQANNSINNSSFGQVHIYYGDGKGKTSAALGTALRALGNNYKVHLVQFMKNGAESLEQQVPGEILALTKFENFSYKRFGLGNWYIKGKNDKEHKEKTQQALSHLKKSLINTDYNIIIADEILYAVQLGLLEEQEVIELIKNKPKNTELILTGSHIAFSNIFKYADLITEIKKIKHPFDSRVQARKGIEY